MISKVHQVKAATPIVSPIVGETTQSSVSIVNAYTKSVEENGDVKWYLYLVTNDDQVFKYRLEFCL